MPRLKASVLGRLQGLGCRVQGIALIKGGPKPKEQILNARHPGAHGMQARNFEDSKSALRPRP